MGVEADLIAYYEAEARGRHRVGQGDLRQSLRERFAVSLRGESRVGSSGRCGFRAGARYCGLAS